MTTTETPIADAAHIYVVVELDNDGIPTTWRSAFRAFDEAAAAVEAHHTEMWAAADMDETDVDPTLEICPDCNGDEWTIGIEATDDGGLWPSWTITRISLA